METETIKVKDQWLNQIKNQFKKFNISPSQYPNYTDPDAFGKTFKQCTILKDVPLITTDSCGISQ